MKWRFKAFYINGRVAVRAKRSESPASHLVRIDLRKDILPQMFGSLFLCFFVVMGSNDENNLQGVTVGFDLSPPG